MLMPQNGLLENDPMLATADYLGNRTWLLSQCQYDQLLSTCFIKSASPEIRKSPELVCVQHSQRDGNQ